MVYTAELESSLLRHNVCRGAATSDTESSNKETLTRPISPSNIQQLIEYRQHTVVWRSRQQIAGNNKLSAFVFLLAFASCRQRHKYSHDKPDRCLMPSLSLVPHNLQLKVTSVGQCFSLAHIQWSVQYMHYVVWSTRMLVIRLLSLFLSLFYDKRLLHLFCPLSLWIHINGNTLETRMTLIRNHIRVYFFYTRVATDMC